MLKIDKKILKNLNENSKIALIADLHFNIFQKHNKFFYHMEQMMDNFMELCKKDEVDAIFILGDMFDTKSSVNTEGLIKVNDIIHKLSQICPVVIIQGNHDLAYFNQSEISLPTNYKYYENVIVVNEPSELKIKDFTFIFFPFTNNIENDLKAYTKKIDFEKNKVVLFSHFGVTSFKVHEYSNDNVNNAAAQIGLSTLDDFNKIFLGHYHGYQSKKNVTYVSSPLQSRHGDELSKHGFVVYDLATNSHKFISNKVTPKFKTFELTKKTANEMLLLKDHYIRIRVTKKVSKELLVSLRQKLMINNFEVKIVLDIPEQMQMSTIQGWNEIVFNDDETLITNFLTKLEEQKVLPFDKMKLLKHLEIELK